ncbi:MAG: DUF324 domain-containing protein [uncultured Sulfurovum sp.]|uniref:DUF324 domain-containing protein n=1 Tax=uncultured Sulfurovum sp. TaxID=269237 RepID=A0A6S6RV28_9BACT|nr:MAG: DUF324 domain-containing protein [uncultured Sulfurovum sp.]
MIKAPYNFVPLSEKVFFPPWAEQVSHDIPFSDGESGEIEIKITAKSPIFIRNHEVDNSDDNLYYTDKNGKQISTEFCNHINSQTGAKEFYIPATSVKGMVKNILEIISFSKIQTSDKKFAYRNFDELYYKQKLLNNTDNIHMGWLYSCGGDWCIEDLGQSNGGNNRIKYTDMALAKKDVIQSRKDAYSKYKLTNYINPITDDGVIVFTGKVGREKTREFIFPMSDINNPIYRYQSDDSVIKNFREAYYLGTPNENDLWKKLFSKRFKKGEHIPIFFLKNQQQEVESFGLSQLYKLPYKYSIADGIGSHANNSEKVDFAETIFGYSKSLNNKVKSLKGRVQFSHLKLSNDKTPMSKIQKTLSTPRAGYFPMYSKDGNSMDTNYIISGWKRYPVHNNANEEKDTNANKDMLTHFSPLPSGSIFKGKIRFHNLRETEIGALYKSLLLDGDDDSICYSLGMAKPYGFGKIKIELDLPKLKKEKDPYIDTFENTMNEESNWNDGKPFKDWKSSEQLQELLAMMRPYRDDYLTYGEKNQKGYEYYGQFKRTSNRRKRLNYTQSSNINEETQVPKSRKKISKPTQVRKLAEELGINANEILKFASEENIDIENEYSFLQQDMVDTIKKYLGNA